MAGDTLTLNLKQAEALGNMFVEIMGTVDCLNKGSNALYYAGHRKRAVETAEAAKIISDRIIAIVALMHGACERPTRSRARRTACEQRPQAGE